MCVCVCANQVVYAPISKWNVQENKRKSISSCISTVYYGQFIININKRSMKEKVPEGKTKTTQKTKEKEGQGFDAVKYETL